MLSPALLESMHQYDPMKQSLDGIQEKLGYVHIKPQTKSTITCPTYKKLEHNQKCRQTQRATKSFHWRQILSKGKLRTDQK